MSHDPFFRKHDELQKEIDKQEAKFKELDRADTRLREDLKHGRNQAATMEAQKEAEKKKVRLGLCSDGQTCQTEQRFLFS